MRRSHWDIFCQVIDHYGDIGVAWRLARQLAAEYGVTVRLWVTDLGAFKRLWPEIVCELETQTCQGVEVHAWGEVFTPVAPAEVVIEAFGCRLPQAYLMAMPTQAPPAVWINLEYLSAEPWVRSHHGLPSLHSSLALTKFFFFPGYQTGTGGVLREHDLLLRRKFFQQHETAAFWQRLGVAYPTLALRVSLFAYANPALPALLDTWALSGESILCLIPEGKSVSQIASWLGESALPVGSVWQRGGLQLQLLPFLHQDDYDRLLWACDINFVRGEDSCVRAQWAQKPFVWQAYPQADNAQQPKLDALSKLYTEDLASPAAQANTALWQAWNGCGDVAQAWAGFIRHKSALDAHAPAWSARLAEPGDLAANLVAFVEAHQAG